MNNIKNVIIPAAGLGTRFLPVTKSIPKEMIPIGNKPAIQYIVEEALFSGIKNFLIITNKEKEAISKYFQSNEQFDISMRDNKRKDILNQLEHIINVCDFSYIDQQQQLGLGHAVLMAQHYIKEEYFGVMLPDDIIVSEYPALNQLMDIAVIENATVIAVQEVPLHNVSSYGIINIKNKINENLFEVSDLVEKPDALEAPSNFGIVGRYVLSNKIFPALEAISKTPKGEIQLTDAIAYLIKNGERVLAYNIQGTRHDIGTPLGWAKAITEISYQNL
ncbi:MAG: UTP--glucose-1-phosphate uridylyltransferase [Candidatus Babeliales bacterium]|nr:UTP--glucose-1-phosphate uridylyltransferase [Candidatus Babeliales bacterium]